MSKRSTIQVRPARRIQTCFCPRSILVQKRSKRESDQTINNHLTAVEPGAPRGWQTSRGCIVEPIRLKRCAANISARRVDRPPSRIRNLRRSAASSLPCCSAVRSARSRPLLARRRRGRTFEFLEHDDDDRLAFLAKEESGFGLDRRLRAIAGIADFTPRQHRLIRSQAA